MNHDAQSTREVSHRKCKNHLVPERPKGGGHLAAMNCVGELQGSCINVVGYL